MNACRHHVSGSVLGIGIWSSFGGSAIGQAQAVCFLLSRYQDDAARAKLSLPTILAASLS